ncbi:MAG TPA: hypothetical protein VG448_11645 [Solirubrobacterales bacterium]|nr:hypothetical protein [Solirubrobacterales bacterium]
MTEPTLTDAAVEQIARRVVELLGESDLAGPGRYVDAATLAAELSVERDWVYAHADELGALRLGGPNGRLRFDRVDVKRRLGFDGSPPRPRKLRSSKYSDGSAVARRPDRLSNTDREVTPMMKPERHDSPSSKGRA